MLTHSTMLSSAAPLLSEEWIVKGLVAGLLAVIVWQVRRSVARIDDHERTVTQATHQVELLAQRVVALETDMAAMQAALVSGAKEMGKNTAEHEAMQKNLDYVGGALNQVVFGKLPNGGPHDP